MRSLIFFFFCNFKINIFSNFRYLSLPNKDGIDTKPGSLPDLTSCYVSSSPQVGGGGDNQCEDQGSHYSSVGKTHVLIILKFFWVET